MNTTSTSWICQQCGAAYISTPPDSGLCHDCDTAPVSIGVLADRLIRSYQDHRDEVTRHDR